MFRVRGQGQKVKNEKCCVSAFLTDLFLHADPTNFIGKILK